MVAAGASSNSVSGLVLLILVLAAGTVYLFGYLRAVMHRANKDYKATKASVKPLRKAFWTSWLAALRIGALVLVGLFLLMAWFVHDVRQADDTSEPAPSTSASVAVRTTGK